MSERKDFDHLVEHQHQEAPSGMVEVPPLVHLHHILTPRYERLAYIEGYGIGQPDTVLSTEEGGRIRVALGNVILVDPRKLEHTQRHYHPSWMSLHRLVAWSLSRSRLGIAVLNIGRVAAEFLGDSTQSQFLTVGQTAWW